MWSQLRESSSIINDEVPNLFHQYDERALSCTGHRKVLYTTHKHLILTAELPASLVFVTCTPYENQPTIAKISKTNNSLPKLQSFYSPNPTHSLKKIDNQHKDSTSNTNPSSQKKKLFPKIICLPPKFPGSPHPPKSSKARKEKKRNKIIKTRTSTQFFQKKQRIRTTALIENFFFSFPIPLFVSPPNLPIIFSPSTKKGNHLPQSRIDNYYGRDKKKF